jgi:hypothetical protein
MWPFKKKEAGKELEIKYTDYNNWEKDLGFLTLVITRKKNITKNYYINIYATQLKDTDYIRDEDIQDIILSGVQEVMSEIALSYKNYLISKYFKNERELIKFITEEFYVDLTSAAIVQNSDKVKANLIKRKVAEVGRQNLRDKEESENEKEKNKE